MEVILKEDVPKLGSRGDVVKVAEGYGRNFLLPKKLAIEATAGNKNVIEQMKAASVRRAQKDNPKPRRWRSSSPESRSASRVARANMISYLDRLPRPTLPPNWRRRALRSIAARSCSMSH